MYALKLEIHHEVLKNRLYLISLVGAAIITIPLISTTLVFMFFPFLFLFVDLFHFNWPKKLGSLLLYTSKRT